MQKKSTRLKRAGQSGSVDPEDRPVKRTKKRKAEVVLQPLFTASGKVI